MIYLINMICDVDMLRLEWNWVTSGNVQENVFTIWPRGKARFGKLELVHNMNRLTALQRKAWLRS